MRRILLPGLALIVTTLQNLIIQHWMLDDAFITFRYAENFASGNGPVFNIGEKVEGYTCFLWMSLLAVCKVFGANPVAFSCVLGFLFTAGTIILLANAHRFSSSIPARASAFAAVLLGTCGIFTPWLSSGMEVSMFTFLLLLSVLLAIRAKDANSVQVCVGLGVSLGLLAMTRPEGILIAGILFLEQLPGIVRNRDWRRLLSAAVFAAIFLPYFLWRWNYYGFLLPNTFYAKVGSTSDQVFRGFRYLLRFATAALPILALLAFRSRVNQNHALRSSLLVLTGFTCYVVFVGGDIMPAFRFLAPLVPLLCLHAGLAISSLLKPQTAVLLITAAVLGNLLLWQYHPQLYPYILSDTVAEDGKEVGLWLKSRTPQNAVIATNTAGSIPYFSGLRTIDMLGLNDVHIAHRRISWIGSGPAGHEKGDGAYVLSKQPDYIQFGSNLGDTVPRFLSDQELWKIPEFHRQYEQKTYTLPSGRLTVLFERRKKSAP